MNIREFVRQFKKELKNKLGEKTSWGRNDVERLVVETVDEVLMAYLDGSRIE